MKNSKHSGGLEEFNKFKRGKTYEVIYGEEKAKLIKQKQRGYRLGRKGTKEMREKCRLNMLGEKNPMYSKVISDEHRLKLRMSKLDKKKSEETKKRMSKAKKGKKFSLEHIEKLRLSSLGHIPWNKGKQNILTKESRQKMREARLDYISKQFNNGEPVSPTVGNYETQILNNLEKCFGYKIFRQHQVMSYFLDGYCPTLSLAIEIDEKYRHNKIRERDIRRQREIEEELNCRFLRIEIPNRGEINGISTT